jgi:DNA-binding transcriptional regulator YiaG
MQSHGLPVGDVADMYHPLHEADISKFADIALGRIREFENRQANPVKRLRKALRITQEELGRRCGITLRMIQAYEQGRQDLSKAEGSTLLNLSRALCCKPEELI